MKIYMIIGAICYLVRAYKLEDKGESMPPFKTILAFIITWFTWPIDLIDKYLLKHKLANKIDEIRILQINKSEKVAIEEKESN